MRITTRASLAGLCVFLATQSAYAAFVTYGDRASFLTDTSSTGLTLPEFGNTNRYPGTGFTSGFAIVAVDIGGTNSVLASSNYTNEISGNDLSLSGPENFDILFQAPRYAFGFDAVEPFYDTSGSVVGCRNSTTQVCEDTTFTIRLYSGATLLESFTFNPPNDASSTDNNLAGLFFGIHSSLAFDRVTFRDGTNNVDNEFFGDFVVGSTYYVPPSPVPIPAAAWLMVSGMVGLGVFGWKGRTKVASS